MVEQDFRALITRFYAIKHRCGRARFYRHVTFGFASARAAAEYMLVSPPGQSIDRIDGRLGYAPGNLRYATPSSKSLTGA